MGWMKIFGIGENSCKVVSELTPLIKRTWGYEVGDENDKCIESSDLICIKGIRRLEQLSYYIQNGDYCWFVLDRGIAFQEVFRAAWKEIKEKIDYCLLFHLFGSLNEEFFYELFADDSINHVIELVEKNTSDVKEIASNVLKGLFYLFFIPSILYIDVTDIKRAFSGSFLVKATSLELRFGDFRSAFDDWLYMLDSPPKFLLLAVIGSTSATFFEVCEIVDYLTSEILSMDGSFERDKDLYWGCFVEEELPEEHYQISLFWA